MIVSQSLAQRLYPNGDALNHKMWWIDPYFGPKPFPRRIVGIVGDVDDERIARGPAMTVYHPLAADGRGRPVVRARIRRSVCAGAAGDADRPGLSANQPVERAATLEDVRAEVLAPERLNAFVFSGFAGVALLIAVVGVAGVLAFGVSARTREFGVRLAIGSTPYLLLMKVLSEGAMIVGIGIVAGIGVRVSLRGRGVELFPAAAHAGPGVAAWRGRRADRRRHRGLADAGGARITRRRPAGASIRVIT